MTAERRVEKLRADHNIEGFDCGREELNRYLLRYAWANQQARAAQTYIGLVGETVIGYHTLAVGQVSREEAPERLTKGLARHPVPIMLLARLAVDKQWHGKGVGKALLKDAMQRTLQAADIARSLFTRRTTKRGVSTRNSISSPPRPIRCTCSYCSRMFGESLRSNKDFVMKVRASLDTFGPTVIPKHSLGRSEIGTQPPSLFFCNFKCPRGFLGVSKTVAKWKSKRAEECSGFSLKNEERIPVTADPSVPVIFSLQNPLTKGFARFLSLAVLEGNR